MKAALAAYEHGLDENGKITGFYSQPGWNDKALRGFIPYVLIVSSRWLSYGHREPVAHKLRVLFYCTSRFPVKVVTCCAWYSTILKILPPERHHLNRTIPLFNRQIHIRVIRQVFLNVLENPAFQGQVLFSSVHSSGKTARTLLKHFSKYSFGYFGGKVICFSNTRAEAAFYVFSLLQHLSSVLSCFH